MKYLYESRIKLILLTEIRNETISQTIKVIHFV